LFSNQLITVIANEFVRNDITDGEYGIPMTLTIQIQDVNLCEPMQDTYVSIWHANATVSLYSFLRRPPLFRNKPLVG